MGLKFYVSEVQGQINDAIRAKNEGQQAIEQLQSSISQFLSAPLSGKAYTSAKNYFQVTYTPLCRAAIMSGEALVNAHRKLLSEYQSTVGSIDTDEDQLREHMANLKEIQRDLERQINNAKTMRPDLERRYINAGESINKVQERIDKLIAYDIASDSFFEDYHTCQSQYNSGLAQVQDSKAWNSASGTFDLGLLDMSWAADVNKRWDERAQAQEQERLDKFNKGMEGRSYCHVQIATGAYKWMWVKDPLKVTQEDLKFNEEYKEYLYILLHPQENGIMDDYFATMAEELRTGKNAKTGELLTDLEKVQRWSTVMSAISVLVIGSYYGSKGFKGENVKAPKESVIKGEKNGKSYTLDKNKSKGSSSYNKSSGVKDTFKKTPEIEQHLKYADPNVPRKRGIGGAHNSEEFFKNDVKVINQTPTDIPGVSVVEYQIPELDAKGIPTGKYKKTVFKKSIYDPSVISDDEYIKRGLEAANNAANNNNGNMPREWVGKDSSGKSWRGFYKDGKLDTFFPD